jgi:hypothetical protein
LNNRKLKNLIGGCVVSLNLITESGANYYDTFCPVSELFPANNSVDFIDFDAWCSINGKKTQRIHCPSEELLTEKIEKISHKMSISPCDMLLISIYNLILSISRRVHN